MKLLAGIIICLLIGGAFSLRCYTCLNKEIGECMQSNQTCGYGMNKCFSMQKEAITGGYRYTKFCADEWYCERYDAACEDLDDPEYAYMECNVGCCTSDFCNHAIGIVKGRILSCLLFSLLTVFAVFKFW